MRSLRSRTALLRAALVLCSTVVAFAVAGADSVPAEDPEPPADDPAPAPASDPLAEPITGTVVMPEPGAETGPLHPFDPPARDRSDVPLDALTPEEQAYVEAGRATDGWADVHAGYGAATREAAARAAAEAAANALGIEGIADMGVTP